MADNELDLFEWQIGKQTVFNTAVAPTAKLMGITGGSFKPNVEGSHVEEQHGDLTPAYNATPDKITAEADIEYDICAEDICFWLDSFFAEATPSGVDPYTRIHTGAGAKPVSRISTLVRGNSSFAKGLTGAVAKTLEISGESNQRLKGKAGFVGYKVEADTVESLSDRVVNFLHANQTKIYIDAFAGTFGATEVTGQKHSFTVSLDANKMHKMSVGDIAAIGYSQQKGDPSANQIKMSLAVDTQSYAFYALQLTTTMSQGLWKPLIRIESEISTSLKWTMDFAGWSPEAPEWAIDADGIASLEFTLSPLYDAVLGSWFKSTVINGVATLP